MVEVMRSALKISGITLTIIVLFLGIAFLTAYEALTAVSTVLAWGLGAIVLLAATASLVAHVLMSMHRVRESKTEAEANQAENELRREEAAIARNMVGIRIHAETQLLTAKARKAEREADLFVITAKQNEQVLISDSNQQGKFVAAHLALSGQINGKPIEPDVQQISAWEKWNTKRGAASPAAGPVNEVAGIDQIKPSLPDKIDLFTLLPSGGPSISSMALGVSSTEKGIEVVNAPLAGMVHVGVGGSSGWGKSVFLQALAFQIAMAPEPAELALVDVEDQTFTPFGRLGRDKLRYPLINNEQDIVLVLDDLRGEWERRRALFAKNCPLAEDLGDYNAEADEPLPYIVLMMDEVNMVTDNKVLVQKLTKLGQGVRKYGLFCVLGGQNWNADDIPTKLRGNFSTRIQLKAMSKSQSRVMLEDSVAADIKDQGRAWCVIPGRELREIQTPYINKQILAQALAANGEDRAAPKMPEVVEAASPEPDKPTDEEAKALEAFAEISANGKFSWRKATQAAFGSGKFGLTYNEKLRRILDKHGVSYNEQLSE